MHVNVQEGERVRAGGPLMDGPSNPHDILNVFGEKALQSYLVSEIQEVSWTSRPTSSGSSERTIA